MNPLKVSHKKIDVAVIGEINADLHLSGLLEQIQTILYLSILEGMTFYRSLKKGLNPEKPKNLSSLVYLD